MSSTLKWGLECQEMLWAFSLCCESLLRTGTKSKFFPHKQVWVELLHYFNTHQGMALSLHGERENNLCLQKDFQPFRVPLFLQNPLESHPRLENLTVEN